MLPPRFLLAFGNFICQSAFLLALRLILRTFQAQLISLNVLKNVAVWPTDGISAAGSGIEGLVFSFMSEAVIRNISLA